MANTDTTNPPAYRSLEENGGQSQISRRRFIATFGAGAVALTLKGCGGNGSVPVGSPKPAPAPVPTNPLPVWGTIPTITFTEGVAATISIAGYATDNNVLAITKNSVALPPGVRFDAPTKSFIYDGIGRTSSTDGHVLTAVEV